MTPDQFQQEFAESDLMREYGKAINRESALEMLAARLAAAPAAAPPRAPAPPAPPKPGVGRTAGKIVLGGLVGALTTKVARSVGRELVRGVLGMLGGKAPRGTRRSRWL